MIAELQKKFIRISVLSVLGVFALIFLLLVLFSWSQLEQTMDTLTDAIAVNDGEFPPFDPDQVRTPSLEVITEETRFSTRFFTVWLDDQDQILDVNTDAVFSLSSQEVEEYVQKALEEGRERGWVSQYRYRILDTQEGAIGVFVNGSTHMAMTGRLVVTAFLVLVGSGALILALTILLSKRVVRPVAESYEKQRQFITDANHELKTPLTLILSNLDIVEEEVGKNEWLEDIRTEGERMGKMINQLVTLSRMEESQKGMVFASFDLSAAVADTVSDFQHLAVEEEKNLSVLVQPGITCQGDEGLIRRLVSILMDNALKYCDPGGEIRVTLTRKRHPVLTVENTYREKDSLELDKLFDRFYRGDKARTWNGSFGVGLSIAKSIVQNHHGTIKAYSCQDGVGFRAELK